MKKILVPTDFSECSINAIKIAAKIAHKTNCEIQLVHVYEKPIYGFVDLYVDHNANHQIKNHIKEQMSVIKENYLNNIRVAEYALEDCAIWELPNMSKFSDCNLVLMGTNGATGFKEFLIGSNTEKMIRMSDIPVLTIHKEEPNFTPKNIVLASSFIEDDNQNLKAIGNIMKLLNVFKPHINLLKVNTPTSFERTSDAMKMMENFKNKQKLKDCSLNIVNDYNVENGIREFAAKNNADLIALTTHGHTGFSHKLFGSIAESIANHGNVPLLTVKLKHEVKKGSSEYFPRSISNSSSDSPFFVHE